jgi:hypothetical protein
MGRPLQSLPFHRTITPDSGNSLNQWLASLHRNSATAINHLDASHGRRLWNNYHDTLITRQPALMARLRYVNNNPVHHRLVPERTRLPMVQRLMVRRFRPEILPIKRRPLQNQHHQRPRRLRQSLTPPLRTSPPPHKPPLRTSSRRLWTAVSHHSSLCVRSTPTSPPHKPLSEQAAAGSIGVGMEHWLAPPLPPNRTGGFPASGSPIGESPQRLAFLIAFAGFQAADG